MTELEIGKSERDMNKDWKEIGKSERDRKEMGRNERDMNKDRNKIETNLSDNSVVGADVAHQEKRNECQTKCWHAERNQCPLVCWAWNECIEFNWELGILNFIRPLTLCCIRTMYSPFTICISCRPYPTCLWNKVQWRIQCFQYISGDSLVSKNCVIWVLNIEHRIIESKWGEG